MPGLRIERMELEHLDEVLEIERASFPTPWLRQAFLSELCNNPVAHYYVGLVDDRVVGYGGMWVILDEAHITTVAVHPDFRGRYIGERLVRHLLAEARGLGAKRATLEVRSSNRAAQSLYRKLGFASRGVRKGYYSDTNEDAVIMWCTLENELPRSRGQAAAWKRGRGKDAARSGN